MIGFPTDIWTRSLSKLKWIKLIRSQIVQISGMNRESKTNVKKCENNPPIKELQNSLTENG